MIRSDASARALSDPSDVHLGSLLAKALRGSASEGELLEFRAHASACSACAALLALGPTLASRMVDLRPDPARDQRTVALALSASRSARTGLPRRAVWGLSAASVMVGSLAAAQYLGAFSARSSSELAPVVRATAPLSVPDVSQPQRSAAPGPVATEAEPGLAGSEAPATPPQSTNEPAIQSAAALFASANELRRAGRDEQAIQSYRQLQRNFAASHETALSHATLGALLLQREDARGALAQFDRYIAHGGPVLEEALAGRARALGRLGDKAAELRAWQTLLKRFPSSVHAARARARLTELR